MSVPHDPFASDTEFGDPDYVKSARDPNRPPETGPEWQRDGRASDIPVTPGGERSPFADPDDEFGTSETPAGGGAKDDAVEFAATPAEPGGQQDASGPASDLDTRKIAVTFFKDEFASSLRRVDMTLPQLAEHIRTQTAASKGDLPLLKLAIFGSKRSAKNCLRTNENTEQIEGVEGEHDVGEISFDTAIAVMREARIRSLLYTSPSYMPASQGTLAHSGAAVAEIPSRCSREIRRAHQRPVRRQTCA